MKHEEGCPCGWPSFIQKDFCWEYINTCRCSEIREEKEKVYRAKLKEELKEELGLVK